MVLQPGLFYESNYDIIGIMRFGQWRPKFLGGPSSVDSVNTGAKGNINERISKIPESISKSLDGVVAKFKDIIPVFKRKDQGNPEPSGDPSSNNDPEPSKETEKKDELLKRIATSSLEKIKGIDWNRASLSASTGVGLKLCARTIFDVVGFWQKTGVAALGGAGSAAVKEWIDQRREADDKLNKILNKNDDLYNMIFAGEYTGTYTEENPGWSKEFTSLYQKKESGERLTVNDFKKYLKTKKEIKFPSFPDQILSNEQKKSQIINELEKLEKKDWKRIATSAAKGAFWGAAGSMVFGDLLHYAIDHEWITVPDSVKDFVHWMEKGVISTSDSLKNTIEPIVVSINIPNTETYLRKITEHVYEFKSAEGVESTTGAARQVIRDYLGNEKIILPSLGKEVLSPEQKIFAEDYLRRTLEAKEFKSGMEFKVKGEWIREAVEKARGLGDVSNLSQYVSRLGEKARELMDSNTPSSLNDLRENVDPIINGSVVANALVVDMAY
jgi:hypothetical protein